MSLSNRPLDLDSFDNRNVRLMKKLHHSLRIALWRYFRPEISGLETVPEEPCIFVCNHNGAMLMPDMFIVGFALYDRFGAEGMPYGLAHQLGLQVPGLRRFLVSIGAVRGTQENGLRLLQQGKKVLIYPGGELDSMRPRRHSNRVVFGERRGYIKLALRSGVPIVPVVASGAHETLWILTDGQKLARVLGMHRFQLKTWPLSLSVPWGLWLGIPPPHFPLPSRIRIAFLKPIFFSQTGHPAAENTPYVEKCHRQVHSAMEKTLRRLSRKG